MEEEVAAGPGRSVGTLFSRFKWKLKGGIPIKVDSISVIEGRFLATSRSNNQRLFSLLRVHLSDSADDSKLDYSAAVRITLQHQRMKGLLDGLHRARIPFLYTMMVKPSHQDESEENQVFEFDLVVGTWVDCKAKDIEKATASCEANASTLAATLAVGLPNSSVRRLTRADLVGFAQSLLTPEEPRLRQVADSSTLSTLESFESHSPQVISASIAPDFYIPNSQETGERGEGIVLGRLKTRTSSVHEFSLQLDDLKRHVSLMGMTGSGKSTTAAVIVRQVAAMGLPVMVLDWHNEHAGLVKSVGGQVLSPGKDDFAINPLDLGPATEQAEHIEMVTDIFSDTYHFTHPQAYMFRNALQRCLTEATDKEVPTLASLVSTIESYPLRSAYDNETKVALLRRLVPLTQGNVGRAFNSPSSHTVDELLDKVLCVELGHIRETQSRSIFADILMKLIYEMRLARKVRMEHITMVEEARNVAPARRNEDPPSVGERMISELRKFGESMLFVAQFPSQVASEVVKNSGVRIIHRIAWAEDLRLIRDSLNLTPEQLSYISTLGVGETVVSLTRLQKPILLQVEAGGALAPERRDLSLLEES
ncbi:MAG: ATP-binding protein [Thaumarchaeota archaeon]|nr:ATP-binding protein [Nitrososphaerota archaeon]